MHLPEPIFFHNSPLWEQLVNDHTYHHFAIDPNLICTSVRSENLSLTKLKAAFTQTPILAHFNPDNPIFVETDASDYAIAILISQISPNNDNIHPITFYSCSM